MDIPTLLVVLSVTATYLLWFKSLMRLSRAYAYGPCWADYPTSLRTPNRMHDWITDNLCACGDTYQTCTAAVPFLARKQGLVTVTCDPKNLEHILKLRFDNYPKGPNWLSVFHNLLGEGIFNSDGNPWLFQRKMAALEFTTRTLRQAMARWVSQSIKLRFCPIVDQTEVLPDPRDSSAQGQGGRPPCDT